MKNFPKLLFLGLCILVGGVRDAFATNRYHSDKTAESPSKKFKVEAKSPDNAGNENGFSRPFQASFVYTLRDVEKNTVLWTRKQPMGAKEKYYTPPKEGSPVALFVSDAGWTVIRTAWDELVVVDIAGKDRGVVRILEDGFTAEENKEYVQDTTAGPLWSGCSLWYFLDAGKQSLFVVTPWWGRRVVLDLKSGKIIPETPDIAKQAALYEKNYVVDELLKYVASTSKVASCDCEDCWRVKIAAYVAGRDGIKEAIPLLEELQNSAYIGSMGGWGYGRKFEGEVCECEYSTFTLRQVTQLALRRLGKTPRQLPATQFDVRYEDYKKNRPYVPRKIDGPRAANAGKIKTGMTPEEVLDLIDAPDFVGREKRAPGDAIWEYDMDAETPFTLLVHWDGRRVAVVEQIKPARWQDGQVRDWKIVY